VKDSARLAALLGSSLAIFLAFNVVMFYLGLYRAVIEPGSSTASFERAIRAVVAWNADRRSDVLVVGDSRIYAGFDPRIANAHGGGLRFLNAGVPGMGPRSWYYFTRAVDPAARRFRALVIPVDSYTDDTSAIGSLDADDHAQDLHLIVFETRPADIPYLAKSFDEPDLQRSVAFDMLLRGPIMRDDVQALLSDPAARVAAREHMDPGAFDPRTVHPFATSLATLRVDFAHDRIEAPSWVSADERSELEKQILRVPRPSPSYAAYRRYWLEPIVRRYLAADVPIVFVRLPARPVHRTYPSEPGGTIATFAAIDRDRVHLISQAPYVALERPEFFADHDHLDLEGGRRFSELLGRDVARALKTESGPSSPTGSVAPIVARDAHPMHALLVALEVGIPMRLQSIDFGFFLAIVFASFYALPRRYRTPMLLLASYYFYLRWNGWYVVFLLFLTVTDFAIALRLEQTRHRKTLLALGIGLNLAFLGAFKYTNFVTSSLVALAGKSTDPWFLALVVPVGISFHTFQSISYLVDVSTGRIAATRKPLDYALYISFFPQLLAGPIVRAGRFLGELTDWHAPDADRIERGVREIALGLVKKLVIADQFAPVADRYFAAPALQPSATAAWCATFAFAIQIYFDFSGYSDIAIGSARLLGFDFPANFRRPYFATGFSDFWRRWHITLSTWLRDYLYIPLGGDRVGTFATYRNLFITMLLGGLWHGANWTFVAWGAYHGALLSVERAFNARNAASRGAPARIVRVGLTFLAVLLGWVLFRAQSFGDAFATYRAMVAGGGGPATLPTWPLVGLVVAFGIGVAQERGASWNWRTRPLALQVATLTTLLALCELASWPGANQPFIYFKF
jgi:alginate O-acetyltransferase complex protein AlgI